MKKRRIVRKVSVRGERGRETSFVYASELELHRVPAEKNSRPIPQNKRFEALPKVTLTSLEPDSDCIVFFSSNKEFIHARMKFEFRKVLICTY